MSESNGFCLYPWVCYYWINGFAVCPFIGYRCIGVKYIQSIINEIIWVEGNLQIGVEDILNEIFGFLSIIIQIIFFLSIPYVLFIKPAYQRMVLKKEWWQILGYAKSDQDETEWTVRFPSLNAWVSHPSVYEAKGTLWFALVQCVISGSGCTLRNLIWAS